MSTPLNRDLHTVRVINLNTGEQVMYMDHWAIQVMNKFADGRIGLDEIVLGVIRDFPARGKRLVTLQIEIL